MQPNTEPRPTGVSALAILSIIGGLLMLGLGLIGFQKSFDVARELSSASSADLDTLEASIATLLQPSVAAMRFWAVVALLEGSVNSITSVGLWMQREWGRVLKLSYSWLAIILVVLQALFNGGAANIIALPLAIFSVWYLIKPEVSDTFLTSYDLRMRRQMRQQQTA